MRILLARQPIFDTAHRVVGYEVMCSDGEPGHGGDEVLVEALLDARLDQVRQGQPAYLHVSTNLLGRALALLRPERAVLLVRADDREDGRVVWGEARQAGFRLILDGYTGAATEAEFLSHVDAVRLDIRAFAPAELTAHAAALRQRRLQLLAGGVSSQPEYRLCCDVGFALFEGYHFSRPEVVERRDLSIQHVRTFRIMRMVRNMAVTEQALEQELQRDAALSYKLLRIVNSATHGGVGVRSIGHAIRLLGREALYRWLALLLISRCSDQALELEIMRAALLRARFCEQLAQHGGHGPSAGSAFLVGLLSALGPYLALSTEHTVRELELATEPALALTQGSGPLGALLGLAVAYENGDFTTVLEVGARLHLTPGLLVTCYLDAIAFLGEQADDLPA